MVLSTETFNQSVRTEYSEAVKACYTFQPLSVSGFSQSQSDSEGGYIVFEIDCKTVVSPQSHSSFSPLLQTFCLKRCIHPMQKYGSFAGYF